MLVDILCCRFKVGKYGQSKSSREPLLENHSDGSKKGVNSLYNNSEFTQSFNPVNLAEPNNTPYGDSVLSNDSVSQELYSAAGR